MVRKYIIIFLMMALIFSCTERDDAVWPDPPLTPVLTSESIWGLVDVLYLKVLKKPQIDSDIVAIFRQGDSFEILARVSHDENNEHWTQIRLPEAYHTGRAGRAGWVPSESLKVYDTKIQADTASRLLFDDSAILHSNMLKNNETR